MASMGPVQISWGTGKQMCAGTFQNASCCKLKNSLMLMMMRMMMMTMMMMMMVMMMMMMTMATQPSSLG